jgi:hypothetical protein
MSARATRIGVGMRTQDKISHMYRVKMDRIRIGGNLNCSNPGAGCTASGSVVIRTVQKEHEITKKKKKEQERTRTNKKEQERTRKNKKEQERI